MTFTNYTPMEPSLLRVTKNVVRMPTINDIVTKVEYVSRICVQHSFGQITCNLSR